MRHPADRGRPIVSGWIPTPPDAALLRTFPALYNIIIYQTPIFCASLIRLVPFEEVLRPGCGVYTRFS